MLAVKAKIVLLALSLCGTTVWLLLHSYSSAPPASETFYYAYSMKGKLVGYMRVTITSQATSRARTIESTLTAKVRLLGFDYDIHKTETYHVDSATDRIIDYDNRTTAGPVVGGASVTVHDGAARYVSKSDGRQQTVNLPSDVLFHDPFCRPFFARDLPRDAQAKTYRFLDVQDGMLHALRVTRTATRQIDLAGRHLCAVFELFDQTKFEKAVIWIDLGSSRWVKLAMADGSELVLADAGVVDRAERAIVDNMILTEVRTSIPRYREIASMRIRARIRVAGEEVTAESLNVDGQRFQGTVREGLIEGMFDVHWPEHARFTAIQDAPRIDHGSLDKYLRPEPGVESEDPEITKLARDLTKGMTDPWDGARRLGNWVSREIRYFPAGGSARQTLSSRQGPCQGYASLVVALCRSVGIPARLVSGCMYMPRDGHGVLGGHLWTEIHIGGAGWIAVDANHAEIHGLDSGHIRLGHAVVAAPQEAEILEYTLQVRSHKSAAGRSAGTRMN